jgi:cytochrome b561
MTTSTEDLTTTPSPGRYTTIAIVLHAVLAIGLLYQLGLGVWMDSVPKTPPGLRAGWFNWHKSIGMVLGLLILVRALWRLTHASPALPSTTPRWQIHAARWNHATLYACMIAMPVSGFLGSSFTKYPIKFFDWPLPRLWEASAELKTVFGNVHTVASYVFMAAVAVHILAAVWHAVRRDGVVLRMLPQRSPAVPPAAEDDVR